MIIGIEEVLIPDTAGYSNTGTSWQVSKDLDFTNTELLIVNVINDTTNLTTYNVDYFPKPDETLYVRVKLHFSNSDTSNWSKIVSVKGCNKGMKFSNTIVVTPTIHTEFTNNDYPLGGFKVFSSQFLLYSGVGNHKATSWYITDSNGQMIWSRENDTDNLYSIRVPDNILKDNRTYILKVVYTTDTNTNSNYGKLVFSTGNLNTKLIVIKYNKIYGKINRAYFDLDVNLNNYQAVDIRILNKNGDEIGSYIGNDPYIVNINTPVFVGEMYKARVRVKIDNDHYSETEEISMIADEPEIKICDDSVFYSDHIERFSNAHLPTNLIISQELPDGTIPMVDDNGIFKLYRYNGTYSLVEVGLVNIDMIGTSDHVFTLMPNNKLVISYLDNNCKFKVCDYDIATSKIKELYTIDRPNEFIADVYTNNIAVVSNNELVYSRDDNKLVKFNVDTKALVELTDNRVARGNGNIVYVCDNKLLALFGGDGAHTTNYTIFRYDLQYNTWTELDTVPSWVTNMISKRQSFRRKDGKIAFFNNDFRTPTEEQKDQNVLTYDPEHNSWAITNEDVSSDTPVRSTLVLKNGKFIRFNSSVVFKYE